MCEGLSLSARGSRIPMSKTYITYIYIYIYTHTYMVGWNVLLGMALVLGCHDSSKLSSRGQL